MKNPLLEGLSDTVRNALAEDIGSGDITAELIPEGQQAKAHIISRDHAVLCGEDWVIEVCRQIDSSLSLTWQYHDGDTIKPDDIIVSISGNARSLLTAERSALNFLQTLSSVSTNAALIAEKVKHTKVKILDTRKTIPGLRLAQKYAVQIGGCFNHRIGLFDAYLIKENHINACGGIGPVIENARSLNPGKTVEIEVESIAQLQEALDAKADIIMLDNFSLQLLRKAVSINAGSAKLEASGGLDIESIVEVAETGVDFISVGSLTKHIRATDFSMLFD